MKILAIICGLLITPSLFANTIKTPTEASKPIPSLSQTKNIDTVLTEKVQKVITETPLLKNQAVSAVSLNGNIILQGSVATKEQEDAAINAAKSVVGVNKVESQLTIKIIP
jgi:osmotically-inducible protein OsmY